MESSDRDCHLIGCVRHNSESTESCWSSLVPALFVATVSKQHHRFNRTSCGWLDRLGPEANGSVLDGRLWGLGSRNHASWPLCVLVQASRKSRAGSCGTYRKRHSTTGTLQRPAALHTVRLRGPTTGPAASPAAGCPCGAPRDERHKVTQGKLLPKQQLYGRPTTKPPAAKAAFGSPGCARHRSGDETRLKESR